MIQQQTQSDNFAPYYSSPETISEELHCSICTHPFVDPVTLKARHKEQQCNHTFCNDCISAWLSTREGTEHKCPYCQTEVSRRFNTADRPICNMVNSLQVRCKYYQPHTLLFMDQNPAEQGQVLAQSDALSSGLGGGWVGTRSEWAGHLSGECAFREVECPHKRFGCGWTSKRSMLEDHLRDCAYQAVSGLVEKVTQLDGAYDKHQKWIREMLGKVVEEAEAVQETLSRPLSQSMIYNEGSQFRSHMKELMKSIVDVLLLFKQREDCD